MSRTDLARACRVLLAVLVGTLALGGAAGAQTITTVAGGGMVSGDGVLATDAVFGFGTPFGVAVDLAGNLYIADPAASVVRRVDAATGIITTVAGDGNFGDGGDGGPATLASLSYPFGLAVDLSGNLYITDQINSRIRKVDVATGFITTVAGNGVFGLSGDGSLATSASLAFPQGVAVDGAGSIYIADTLNWRIRKVDVSTGIIETIAGTFDTDGIMGTGDGGLAVEATFAAVQRVAVDLEGNVFVADSNGPGGVIRRIDAVTGIITTVAGGGTGSGDSGSALDADLVNARDVSPDAAGNLYIAGPYRVWRVDTAGNISVYAGTGVSGFSGDGGPAVDAQLSDLVALVAGGDGSLFLADAGNARVRKVSPAGIVVPPDILIDATTPQATLDGLVDVPGNLVVDNAVGLATLDLLNLTAVGCDLRLTRNPDLMSFTAPALDSVGCNFMVSDNPALEDVTVDIGNGVGGDVTIDGNETADGVGINIGGGIGGDVTVTDNTAATNVDLIVGGGVGGDITVSDNTAANDVDVIVGGTVGGDITITDNDGASTIEVSVGQTIGGSIMITDNDGASTIEVSVGQTIGGSITITDNGDAEVNVDTPSIGGDVTI